MIQSGILINIGSGVCVVTPGALVLGEVAFDALDLTSTGATSLEPAEQLRFDVAFTPDRVGPIVDTVPIDVDWDRHAPIQVILMGEGIDAGLTTFDIDMGEVEVGNRKDSVVRYVQTAGDVPVVISSVGLMGPDQSAFIVDPALIGLTGMTANEVLSGDLAFLPQRAGPALDDESLWCMMPDRLTVTPAGSASPVWASSSPRISSKPISRVPPLWPLVRKLSSISWFATPVRATWSWTAASLSMAARIR